MARSKIFGPQYPVSVEREYLRHLNNYANSYVKFMREGLAEILPDLREKGSAEQPRLDDSIESKIGKLFKFVDDKMKVKFSEQALRKIARGMVAKNNKHTKSEVNKMFAGSFDKETDIQPLMTDEGLSPYFKNIVDMNVSLIRSIPKYKEEQFKNDFIRLITKDASYKTIQAMILKNFKLTKSRAEMIARDQVGKLNGALDQHRQEQLGITRYIWRTSKDQRVREDHKKLDGKTFRWDNPPIVNRKTGERGNPKEDINCRCWAEPIIEDIIET